MVIEMHTMIVFDILGYLGSGYSSQSHPKTPPFNAALLIARRHSVGWYGVRMKVSSWNFHQSAFIPWDNARLLESREQMFLFTKCS